MEVISEKELKKELPGLVPYFEVVSTYLQLGGIQAVYIKEMGFRLYDDCLGIFYPFSVEEVLAQTLDVLEHYEASVKKRLSFETKKSLKAEQLTAELHKLQTDKRILRKAQSSVKELRRRTA